MTYDLIINNEKKYDLELAVLMETVGFIYVSKAEISLKYIDYSDKNENVLPIKQYLISNGLIDENITDGYLDNIYAYDDRLLSVMDKSSVNINKLFSKLGINDVAVSESRDRKLKTLSIVNEVVDSLSKLLLEMENEKESNIQFLTSADADNVYPFDLEISDILNNFADWQEELKGLI